MPSFRAWTWAARVCWVAGLCWAVARREALDAVTAETWAWARESAVFRHDSFEPVLATAAFGTWIWLFYVVDETGVMDACRLHQHSRGKNARGGGDDPHWQGTAGKAALAYLAPILLFDWWVPRRHLPDTPPTFFGLLGTVVSTIVAYDFLFFFVHLAMHRVPWLREMTGHGVHHSVHPVVSTEVVHHSFVDGSLQVLANVVVLKLLRAHPLARAMHNVVITYLLTETHAGYDAPWMLHHVIPFGVWGGAPRHDVHHRLGTGNFQQFLTYLDAVWGTEVVG